MSIQLKLAAWLVSVVAVLGVLYGAYHYGRHVQSLVDDKMRAQAIQAQEQRNQAALQAYSDSLTKAGEQHDKDQRSINTLHDQLGRVRVRFPAGCSLPANTQASTDSGGAAKLFPESVDGLFADLQARIGKLVERCDQLNIDAIRQNAVISGPQKENTP